MANITCIPLEILEKILINLPVKSLLSCRCVSKTWRSLTSEPGFVRKHLSHASRPENVSGKTLFSGFKGDLSCAPLSTLQPQHLRPCPPFGLPKKSCHWRLVASCDGLLCLWVEGSVYIWNPCLKTNASYTRVSLPTDYKHYDGVYLDFGYDSTADDYKLFLLTKKDGGETIIETRVFSLRSEIWTKLEDYPENICNWPMLSAFVNNTFHWIGYGYREGRKILSFDLSKGKYGEVGPLPEYSGHPYLGTCVLNGMLGVTVRVEKLRSPRHFIVWVMKDYYCRPGEWTKILDITLGNDDDFSILDVRPVYVDENGVVKVGVFSRYCGTRRGYIINNQNRRFVHVESLISPPVPVATAAAAIFRRVDETDLTDGDYESHRTCFLLSRDKYVDNL